jgi:hypothetical protein
MIFLYLVKTTETDLSLILGKDKTISIQTWISPNNSFSKTKEGLRSNHRLLKIKTSKLDKVDSQKQSK